MFPIPPSQPPELTAVDCLFLVLLEVAFITLKVIVLFCDL